MRIRGVDSFARLIAATFVAALVAPAMSLANDPIVPADSIPGEFSANVALTNDYVFRGFTQTGNHPALQGGFDYSVDVAKDVSLSGGVWGSNINFGGNVEVDLYGGLSGSINGVDWSATVYWYAYPGGTSASNLDYLEIAGSLGYDFGFAAVSASINYSPDYTGGTGTAVYYAGGVDVPVGKYFTAFAHVGYQTIDENTSFGLPDYVDYALGVTFDVLGFDVSLSWTDTDVSNADLATYGGVFSPDADGIFVASVSRSF